MEHLKELVKQLERETDTQAQVLILQKIGAKLINEYEIQIGDLTIEPLLVEAYYHDAKAFPDISVHAANEISQAPTYVHARKRQKNHFGELYVHYGRNDGIDVVLSQGNYTLSYLIKNALINGKFVSQCGVTEHLCGACGRCGKGMDCVFYGENILRRRKPTRNSPIVYLPRKGISGKYARCPLAALPLDEISKKEYSFTLATGYGIQWRMAVYALEKAKMEEERAKAIIKEEGLYSSSIEEKYWMLAKETLSGN